MSLHSFLDEVYGSGSTKKRSKKTKSKEKVRVEPASRSIIITEKLERPLPSRLPNAAQVDPLNKKESKKLWKNLDTDELVREKKAITLDPGVKKLSSGAHAGLQTVEQLQEQTKAKQLQDARSSERTEVNQTTVFRDESGRKITNYEEHVAGRQQEKASHEQLETKRLADLNMGEVQKYMMENSISEVPKLSSHNELAFEDPESLFGNNSTSPKNVPISFLGRKLYDKLYTENRFGIAPGYRWDGVDRSNGFEKKWFRKQREMNEKKVEKYTLREDD